jgi:hypothetical protein
MYSLPNLRRWSNGLSMLYSLSYGRQPVRTVHHGYLFRIADTIVGCDQLAAIEENIVTAFTEVGGDDNSRITITLNKAYKVCGSKFTKPFLHQP